jgi:hypothetical protein
MSELIPWLAGVVAGVVISMALTDTLYFVLARLFGGFRRSRNLRGRWTTAYSYERNGETCEDNPTFTVKMIGKYFLAKGSDGKDGSEFRLRGKLSDERIVTGTWNETTKSGSEYYGSFQISVAPTNNEMHGKWIGFSRSHKVQAGSWSWQKSTEAGR